jgi:TonB family protein
MKQTLPLLLFFCCFYTLTLHAQVATDPASYKAVVINYNSNWEVTKPEQAVYKRVAYMQDSLRLIPNVLRPEFNHTITDYYTNGVVMARGNYNKGKKWGVWMVYFANGQLDCKGQFDNNLMSGKWEFWRPDGRNYMVAEFSGYKMKVLDYWNEEGEQTITNGEGTYSTLIYADNGVDSLIVKGPFANGVQYGHWTASTMKGEVEVEQHFDGNGQSLNGYVYKNGKKVSEYGRDNRFRISPEPNHFDLIDAWRPDRTQYDDKYPLIADIMGYKVEKVKQTGRSRAISNYYYNVIQEFEGHADTVQAGSIFVLPYFSKNIQSYIKNNFKFPNELNNHNIEGILSVEFRVKTDGTVVGARISRSLHPMLDAAALKMVEGMPKWKPGTVNGKPLEVTYTLPIRINGNSFKTDDDQHIFNPPFNERYMRNAALRGVNDF